MKNRLFIGGLNDDVSRQDLERTFEKFGTIKDIWVARNPPGTYFFTCSD